LLRGRAARAAASLVAVVGAARRTRPRGVVQRPHPGRARTRAAAAPPRGPVLAPSAAVTAKAMTNSNLHMRVQLGDLARMAPMLGSWQAPAARRTCSWSWSET